MKFLMLLVASVPLQTEPAKPVVTAADHAAMRAACVRWSAKLPDATTRPAQLKLCLAQIPATGSVLVTQHLAGAPGGLASAGPRP